MQYAYCSHIWYSYLFSPYSVLLCAGQSLTGSPRFDLIHSTSVTYQLPFSFCHLPIWRFIKTRDLTRCCGYGKRPCSRETLPGSELSGDESLRNACVHATSSPSYGYLFCKARVNASTNGPNVCTALCNYASAYGF